MSRLVVMVVAGFIILVGGAGAVMQQLGMGLFAPTLPEQESAVTAAPKIDLVRFVLMEPMNILRIQI